MYWFRFWMTITATFCILCFYFAFCVILLYIYSLGIWQPETHWLAHGIPMSFRALRVSTVMANIIIMSSDVWEIPARRPILFLLTHLMKYHQIKMKPQNLFIFIWIFSDIYLTVQQQLWHSTIYPVRHSPRVNTPRNSNTDYHVLVKHLLTIFIAFQLSEKVTGRLPLFIFIFLCYPPPH